MSNAIKYRTGNLTGSLQKGNVALGLDILGPTSTTGWYSGLTPTPGRYVVYETDIVNTPRVYFPANDAELIRLARQEGATGANTGSVQAILAWAATQTNVLIANESYPRVVTDGLVDLLDASFTPSYPTTGTAWFDLSGNASNSTLRNGPTFNSGAEFIQFDGVDDYTDIPNPGGTGSIQFTYYWPGGAQSFIAGGGDGAMLYNGGNGITIHWYPANGGYDFAGALPNRAGWYNIAVTWGGTNDNKMYFNGVLVMSSTAYSISKSSTWFFAGNYYQPQAIGLQTIQSYNKILTQAEVLQNHHKGNIVTNGLILAVNARNIVSYQSGSTITYNLSGSTNSTVNGTLSVDFSGSLVNGTGYNNGYGGNWIFAGDDDYIDLSTFPAISYANGITIEIVIRFAGLGGGGWERFLDTRNASGTGNFISFGRNSVFNNIFFQCSNITGGDTQRRYVTTGNPLIVGEIAFYTVTMGAGTPGNENSNIVLYKNGIPLAASFSDGIPRQPSTTIRNQNYIARSPFVGNSFLSGSIYQFKMYDRGLSASEVAQNFGAQRSIYGI